jgi:hypothetical protein
LKGAFEAAKHLLEGLEVNLRGVLLELGRDNYTEVVPAPQRGAAVVTREVRGVRWRPAKAPARPADRH